MSRSSHRRTVAGVLVTVSALVAALAVPLITAPAASADAYSEAALAAKVSPIVHHTDQQVTADGLPTVQIDGVVWSQTVVGNTVYAGGDFANARPAGAAAGTNLTPRANLLAYDITTGNLITSFNNALNAQAKVVTASPDGSRLYVGGYFTTVNGVNRYRIAAFSTATGQLINSFAPALDASVLSISATNSVVYVGGNFSVANGVARAHLAAFDATNGALLDWAPTTDDLVQGVQITPDGSRVVVGGQFLNVNGAPAYGLAAVDAVTGTTVPWAIANVVKDAGTSASILGLSSDGDAVYGVAYVYGSGGNFEGVFSAEPNTGAINWLADCHGDTYSAVGLQNAVYVASHMHYCTNIGGFPDNNPRNTWYRGNAFTKNATGLVQPNLQLGGGYGDMRGQPSPSLIDWLPDLAAGTFTGQDQAAWSMSGNSQYVVAGGEFPKVNNVAQQGLVRFAVKSIAPNQQGPRVSAADVQTSLVARSSTSVRVAWQTNYDRDDQTLTYTVFRDGVAIKTMTATSHPWDRPNMGFVDGGLAPGSTHTYRVRASDPGGKVAYGNTYSITLPATDPPAESQYVQDVLAANPTDYWRLDQASGDLVNYSRGGYTDMTVNSGVTAGAGGAIAGDSDTAATFNGTSTGFTATNSAILGPNTFSLSAWFATTTTKGGKIVGFGNRNTGNSSWYDRHIYMDTSGRIVFGVSPVSRYTITTTRSYNDGQYHQVVANLSGAGLALYVDGVLIGTNTGTATAQPYIGYWRIGGDASWSGSYFAGRIDEVAIYPNPLTGAQVKQQYVDSGRSGTGMTAPADAYGKQVWNDGPYLYYRVDETSGTNAADASGDGYTGKYSGGYTLGQASPVTGVGSAVRFSGTNGTIYSPNSVAGPNVYSEEAWFSTTSSAGGKIIGFGNRQTGNSTSYDRHVYMLTNGQLVFGAYTNQVNTATSTKSYNDGKWHHVVATQGGDGMRLYVDGVQVATNPATTAQAYSGYWRVGGDNLTSWTSGSGYFNGLIDEPAVYYAVLTPDQVKAHFAASPASASAAPTAAFSATPTDATVAFDASASSDDGTITSYAWDFGDGSTGSGVTASHTYATSGTYTVTLTVTDNSGLTGTVSHDVTVTVPNQLPTAAFTSSPAGGLAVDFDASGSSDPDGTIASYAWTFGDGGTDTGVSPSHTYAAGGTYTVTLTVTDDRGGQNTVSHDVTVSNVNVPPTAAFTAGTDSSLTASFDGTGSSDSDGTIASYAWDFGDGTTGSGPTTTHTYASPTTYTVTLTVTDDKGATGTVSHTVTVPANLLAADAFGRTTSAGSWGSADVGGPWSLSGGASSFSVSGGLGRVNLGAAGAQPTALLNGVSATNFDVAVDSSVNKVSDGSGTFVILLTRRATGYDYRLKARYLAAGALLLQVSRVVNGAETVIAQQSLSLTYAAGDTFRIRFTVSGSGSTTIAGKMWRVGTSEPAAPQVSVSDSTASLQTAGVFGIQTALAGNSTSAPVAVTYDNLVVSGQ